MMKSTARRWAGGLLLAVLVALSGAGCTKQVRKNRYLTRANTDFQAGQYDRAEVEYLKVLQLDPGTLQAAARLGSIYYDQGRYHAALAYLQPVAEMEPDNADVWLKLCLTRFSLGRLKEARDDALKILKQQPGQQEALTTLAEAALTAKDLDETRQQLDQLRRADQDRAGYHLASAVLLLKQGQPTNAATELQKALALEPKSPAVLAALGNFYWLQGDLKQAEAALKSAADLSPVRSPRKLRYAEFKRRQGNLVAARQVLEDLTRQAPDYLPAWLALGQLALEEGKLDECNSVAQRVLNRAPESYEAMMLRGQITLAQGDAAQAVTEFTRMSELYQRWPQVQVGLGRAYLLEGDLTKALARLERALNLNPNDADAIIGVAEVRLAQRDPAAAIRSLTDLLKRQPELVNAEFLLASAYLAQENPAEAVAVYQRMQQHYPKEARVPVALASVLARQGQRAEARQLCAKAMELAPGYLPALELLADLDLADNHPQAAVARVNEQIAKQPSSPDLQLLLAQIHRKEHDPAGAEAPLLKAIELAPKMRQPYQVLAQVYVDTQRPKLALDKLGAFLAKTNDVSVLMQMGMIQEGVRNYTAARDAYEKLLSVNPSDAAALNNLAYIYAEYLNQPDKALEAAERAHQLLPSVPSATDTLGWAWFHKGEYLKALPLLEEAAGKKPESPEMQFHLGMVRYALGQEAPARSALQTAVSASRDFEGKAEAQTRLAILAIEPKAASAEAKSLLEKRLGEAPEDTLALGRLAAIYDRDGAVEQAAKTYEQLLKQAPKNVPALARLSQLYAGPLKNPQKALELAKDAHAAAPGDASISQTLGHLVLQTGDYKWAAGLLQEAASAAPNEPELCYDLAWARYGLGQLQGATTAMQTALAGGAVFSHGEEAKRFLGLVGAYSDVTRRRAAGPEVDGALKADPNYVPALMVQELQQQDKGSFPEAKKTLEQVLGLNPQFAPAQRDFAVLCAAHFTDEPKAFDSGMKARDTFPDDASLAGALGVLAYNRGNFTAAAQYLRQALQTHPGDGVTLYYLGMAQYQLKAKAESKSALQQALALNLEPKLADQAKRTLAELK